MAGKNWTEDRTQQLETFVEGVDVVSQEQLKTIAKELDVTPRSVGSKLRKLGYNVQNASETTRSKWSDEDEANLRELLTFEEGNLTFSEIAASFEDGKYSSKAIQGKILSMEMTDYVKPTPKVEAQRTYTPEQEKTFIEMVKSGAYIETIAEALDKSINSVRGKALSLSRQVEGFVIPRQGVSHAKSKVDAIEALGTSISTMTVDEIAEKVDKTTRGVKTTLTRRKLTCADYDGNKKAAKAAKKAEAAAEAAAEAEAA